MYGARRQKLKTLTSVQLWAWLYPGASALRRLVLEIMCVVFGCVVLVALLLVAVFWSGVDDAWVSLAPIAMIVGGVGGLVFADWLLGCLPPPHRCFKCGVLASRKAGLCPNCYADLLEPCAACGEAVAVGGGHCCGGSLASAQKGGA